RVESAVARAGGDDHRATGNVGSVRQVEDEMSGFFAEAGRRARTREMRAELLRLDHGALREVGTRDARREPEIVLDTRAGAGLAADRDHLDSERPEPFGCAVDR